MQKRQRDLKAHTLAQIGGPECGIDQGARPLPLPLHQGLPRFLRINPRRIEGILKLDDQLPGVGIPLRRRVKVAQIPMEVA